MNHNQHSPNAVLTALNDGYSLMIGFSFSTQMGNDYLNIKTETKNRFVNRLLQLSLSDKVFCDINHQTKIITLTGN